MNIVYGFLHLQSISIGSKSNETIYELTRLIPYPTRLSPGQHVTPLQRGCGGEQITVLHQVFDKEICQLPAGEIEMEDDMQQGETGQPTIELQRSRY